MIAHSQVASRSCRLLHQSTCSVTRTSHLSIILPTLPVPRHCSSRKASLPSTPRSFTTTPTMMTHSTPDWSATHYLRFANERTRAVHDLITRLAPNITNPKPRIYDLGCGPGNSSSVLLSIFPGAHVTGVDTSADMLSKARAAVPTAEFVSGDLAQFTPPDTSDLIFSNAAIHWLRSPTRIATLQRLFRTLKPGAVLAFQVPDNYHEPSHESMRVVARMEGTSWSPFFADTSIGDVEDKERPDLDPIEAPAEFYNALAAEAASVDSWRTTYMHVLDGPEAVVDWVRATGLQPYVNRIADEGAKREFLKAYLAEIEKRYPRLEDGKVMLGYPRLFVVAVRK